MELIKIKPCNNTFFRDGSQFEKGFSNYIKSKNTPYPSVFFGAIFTALLAENDDFREKFFSENRDDHEKVLNIGQVYLYNEETREVYIPAPKDLFINSNGQVKFGEFKEFANDLHSLSFERVLESPEDSDYKRVKNKYINIKNIFGAYSKKQEIRIDLKDEEDIFVKNIKLGIGLSYDKKTVEEGRLYRIEQTEFVDDSWLYLIEYNLDSDYLECNYEDIELNDLNEGYLKLGGEGKVCSFKKVENKKVSKFNENKKSVKLNSNRFKLIFTSDVFFEGDIKEVLNGEVRLIGLANDKPLYIGGYDMKSRENNKGMARAMYKGYGAGTVALLETRHRGCNIDYIENKINLGKVKGFGEFVVLEENN